MRTRAEQNAPRFKSPNVGLAKTRSTAFSQEVEDGVSDLAGGRLGPDLVEEADELLIVMSKTCLRHGTLHVPTDDAAAHDVKHGEEHRRCAALAIVRHRADGASATRVSGSILLSIASPSTVCDGCLDSHLSIKGGATPWTPGS
jgi:hypothetical protein